MRPQRTWVLLLLIACEEPSAALAPQASSPVRATGGRSAEVILAQDPEETPADCIDLARDTTLLDDDRVIDLCAFSLGTAPVACFLTAQKSTLLTELESIELCRCARSNAPVTCYLYIDDNTLIDRARILPMCRATTILRLFANCTPIDFWPAPQPPP